MYFTIYKVTNKMNKKCYIGFDINWPDRKIDHLYEALNKNQKQYNYILSKAIRKYGWESFEWEIIYQSLNGKHCLKIMEPYFIKEHNSYCNWKNGGYNMTLGGDGVLGLKWTEDSRLKKSMDMKGKNIGPKWWNRTDSEYFSKIAKGNKNRLGKTFSVESRKKMAISNSLEWIITNPSGEKIQIVNLKQFCIDNNLAQAAMWRVAQGKQKYHKNWKCERIGNVFQ